MQELVSTRAPVFSETAAGPEASGRKEVLHEQ